MTRKLAPIALFMLLACGGSPPEQSATNVVRIEPKPTAAPASAQPVDVRPTPPPAGVMEQKTREFITAGENGGLAKLLMATINSGRHITVIQQPAPGSGAELETWMIRGPLDAQRVENMTQDDYGTLAFRQKDRLQCAGSCCTMPPSEGLKDAREMTKLCFFPTTSGAALISKIELYQWGAED